MPQPDGAGFAAPDEHSRASSLAAQHTVDPENPWLGLASFTEETRQYFHGREEEVSELCRRVQRKLLTVLFGQSGLGKTSILRAGIVPRLRREGYCPVYVRIDYSRETPPPTEQIKQAIFHATQAAGAWTQPGTAVAGESMWEFLHHRDDVLHDASGKVLVPLLIFDQFEEIFTLAQSDDFGRQRAAEFLDDLADLVENRAPRALEAKIEEDDASVGRFDFARTDYRILIALREDYLAHLEGVKGVMPSITQNRMRLARMTGQQALSAVLKPGGRLVSEEVASAIVRFTAGGSELVNAEVEPSLLSLICRELNNARIVQGRSEISADLLAGSRDTILSDFYERALADQSPGVRQVIEDNLLTDSGYRESLAEERLQKAFAAVGAPRTALATLVERRLLRVEERLDVRRVELTHDVLCSVVRASRDARLEREALEAAERQLAIQRTRELTTRRAMVRARQVAVVCIVLAIGAVAGAVFGYLSAQRAQQAELKSEHTRQLGESAKSEAEKLIAYLLDDFYRELASVGRLAIVSDLAKRAVDYYDALPPELRTNETERNRAVALGRFGLVQRQQAKLEEAEPALSEAVKVLGRLQQEGDRSEITAIGLGSALNSMAGLRNNQNKRTEALQFATQAESVLKPLMSAPSPSIALRRAYGGVMTQLGLHRLRADQPEQAVPALEAALAAYRSIDGLTLGDLSAAAGYLQASAWQIEALRRTDRAGDARRIGQEAIPMAARILEKRPGHMQALFNQALIGGTLIELELDVLNLRKALDLIQATDQAYDNYLKIDPSNGVAWSNRLSIGRHAANTLWRLGRVGESLNKSRTLLDFEGQAKGDPNTARVLTFISSNLAGREADSGDRRAAGNDLEVSRRFLDVAVRDLAPESLQRIALVENSDARYALLIADNDWQSVRDLAQASLQSARASKPTDDTQKQTKDNLMRGSHRRLAQAAYRLKEYGTAEIESRKASGYEQLAGMRTVDDRRNAMNDQIMLAMAVARQEKFPEAQQAIAPALKSIRELNPRSHDDLTLRVQYARVLYASALTRDGKESASLKEAAALLDALPPAVRLLKSTAEIRGWIVEEQKKPANTALRAG